jgi:hypothetical protein
MAEGAVGIGGIRRGRPAAAADHGRLGPGAHDLEQRPGRRHLRQGRAEPRHAEEIEQQQARAGEHLFGKVVIAQGFEPGRLAFGQRRTRDRLMHCHYSSPRSAQSCRAWIYIEHPRQRRDGFGGF